MKKTVRSNSILLNAYDHHAITKDMTLLYKGKDVSHLCNGVQFTGVSLDVRALIQSIQELAEDTQ